MLLVCQSYGLALLQQREMTDQDAAGGVPAMGASMPQVTGT
jgi:hypothetical protein